MTKYVLICTNDVAYKQNKLRIHVVIYSWVYIYTHISTYIISTKVSWS